MKTICEDGLYTRNTTFNGIKIKVTAWRSPYSWVVKATSQYGSVEFYNAPLMTCFKCALGSLRRNIPIWSDPNYGMI